MSDLEQRTRQRAYQISLGEGGPEGRELDHWKMAADWSLSTTASDRL